MAGYRIFDRVSHNTCAGGTQAGRARTRAPSRPAVDPPIVPNPVPRALARSAERCARSCVALQESPEMVSVSRWSAERAASRMRPPPASQKGIEKSAKRAAPLATADAVQTPTKAVHTVAKAPVPRTSPARAHPDQAAHTPRCALATHHYASQTLVARYTCAVGSVWLQRPDLQAVQGRYQQMSAPGVSTGRQTAVAKHGAHEQLSVILAAHSTRLQAWSASQKRSGTHRSAVVATPGAQGPVHRPSART